MNTKLFSKSLIATVIVSAAHVSAASYEVKEVPSVENYRQHYAKALNDNGTVVGIARDSYEFPIYNESYLTTLQVTCELSDEELATGELDEQSAYCLKSSLQSDQSQIATSPLYQKVGDVKAFISSNDINTVVNLSDIVDSDLGDYTRSNVEQLTAINNQNIAVGAASAPYLPAMFEQSGDEASEDPIKYWSREYASRAMVHVDNAVVEIEPVFTEYGGVSGALDVSDSGYVAGYSSVGFADGFEEQLTETCNTELTPVEVCAWAMQLTSSIYSSAPVVWQVDNGGNVIASTVYELAFEPNENQTANYSAKAIAVNDSGVAVGYSQYPFSEDRPEATELPVVFNNEGTELIVTIDDYYQGQALDINSSGVVVGRVVTRTGFEFLTEFFVYDTTTSEFSTPEGFYTSSDSSAVSINDAGLVVGSAEFEITTESTRRKHGFLYDSKLGSFQDLNDLISCDSEYEIVESIDINNNNEILASALKMVEVKDVEGNTVLDDNGSPVMDQQSVSVLLTPVAGGQAEGCSKDKTKYERAGFSNSSLLTFILIPLAYIRRRFKK